MTGAAWRRPGPCLSLRSCSFFWASVPVSRFGCQVSADGRLDRGRVAFPDGNATDRTRRHDLAHVVVAGHVPPSGGEGCDRLGFGHTHFQLGAVRGEQEDGRLGFGQRGFRVHLGPIGDSQLGCDPGDSLPSITLGCVVQVGECSCVRRFRSCEGVGSIFFGLATPTEAAGVGAAGALLLAVFKGSLTRPEWFWRMIL